MPRVKLAVGDVFVEDGEELTVIEIDRDEGQAVFENEDGDEVVMDLADAREAIRDGDLERVAVDVSGE